MYFYNTDILDALKINIWDEHKIFFFRWIRRFELNNYFFTINATAHAPLLDMLEQARGKFYPKSVNVIFFPVYSQPEKEILVNNKLNLRWSHTIIFL